jgi:hypothetical protein
MKSETMLLSFLKSKKKLELLPRTSAVKIERLLAGQRSSIN